MVSFGRASGFKNNSLYSVSIFAFSSGQEARSQSSEGRKARGISGLGGQIQAEHNQGHHWSTRSRQQR